MITRILFFLSIILFIVSGQAASANGLIKGGKMATTGSKSLTVAQQGLKVSRAYGQTGSFARSVTDDFTANSSKWRKVETATPVNRTRIKPSFTSTIEDTIRKEKGTPKPRIVKVSPDRYAVGNHSTIVRNPEGKITKYATYKTNIYNPTGFQLKKRVDTQYAKQHSDINTVSEIEIFTPHIHSKKVIGNIRPAKEFELPN